MGISLTNRRSAAVLAAASILLLECQGFIVSPNTAQPTPTIIKSPWKNSQGLHLKFFGHWQVQVRRRRSSWPLFMNVDSDDPFQVLGLDEPTSDKKAIKRAYKRMALKFHPDVATSRESTPEERKVASDRFAKINWAYDVLSGKGENDSTYSTGSSSARSASANSGWTPPHRRSGAYSSSSTGGGAAGEQDGFDWTDFMPKYNEEEYDAGGDSFGKIFSDLFVGAAAGAAGLGGGSSVFRDFIEFLEGNVDGYGGVDDDADLRLLLQTGSLDEIRNELDDTELVVQQLQSKLSGIKDEILTATAEAKMTTRYIEKIELEESLAELNARKDVVQGYVKKAQKRLVSLQTRYKELLTGGGRDTYGGRSSRSSWDDIRNEARSTSSSSSSPSSSYSTSGQTRSTRSSSASSTSSGGTTAPGYSTRAERSPKSEEDSWMNEGFGSSTYGRGRGSGRQRSRRGRPDSASAATGSSAGNSRQASPRTETARSDSSDTRRATASPSSSGSYARSSRASRSTASYASARASSSSLQSTSSSSNSNVPPHRRTSGSYENQQEKDKRRMRELKVDDEFDKLKEELGL